jgi:membrane associated rhomboid family serine protease
MIPLRDSNPSRRLPLVTILVILANTIIFLYEVTLGPRSSTSLSSPSAWCRRG